MMDKTNLEKALKGFIFDPSLATHDQLLANHQFAVRQRYYEQPLLIQHRASTAVLTYIMLVLSSSMMVSLCMIIQWNRRRR
jgi:hypothetical protein